MTISKIGGTGSDNWELISSTTTTGGAAAVNFTGLSSYRKLMLVFPGISTTTNQDARIRLNNDTTAKYFNIITSSTGTIGVSNQFNFTFNVSGSATHNGYAIFSATDTTGVKILETGVDSCGTTSGYAQGYYLASAAITQVNFYTASTFIGGDPIALYGVK